MAGKLRVLLVAAEAKGLPQLADKDDPDRGRAGGGAGGLRGSRPYLQPIAEAAASVVGLHPVVETWRAEPPVLADGPVGGD